MNSLTTEAGFVSLNKQGEQLCGDRVEWIEQPDGVTLVLADGLGSGVKANILSTLTAKIIATMMAEGLPVEECVRTIASTLPVCQQRQVAYSTFTILQVRDGSTARIIQFDNPSVILLRAGKNCPYPMEELWVDDKKIFSSTIDLLPEDMFVLFSDGAVYAGIGHSLAFGWGRENIISFLEGRYRLGRVSYTHLHPVWPPPPFWQGNGRAASCYRSLHKDAWHILWYSMLVPPIHC